MNFCALKPKTGTAVLLLSLWFAAAAAQAGPGGFPDVPLMEGSQPRYAVLALDAAGKKAAYLLFDGNTQAGYKRVYVWTPADRAFKTPRPLAISENNRFGPIGIELTPAEKQEKAQVVWQVSWSRRTVGGTHKRKDYATGKTITTTSERRTHSVFGFSCHFAHPPQEGAASPTSNPPLDLVMSGDMGTKTEWKQVGGPFAPWHRLTFGMSFNAARGEDTGRIRFKGRLYYGNRPCNVRSMPTHARVSLKVEPYMEKPVYENSVPATEAMTQGIEVELPYGWYTFRWGMSCPPLKIRTHHHGIRWPWPFSKPLPQ